LWGRVYVAECVATLREEYLTAAYVTINSGRVQRFRLSACLRFSLHRVACLLTVSFDILSGALTTSRPQPGLYAIQTGNAPCGIVAHSRNCVDSESEQRTCS